MAVITQEKVELLFFNLFCSKELAESLAKSLSTHQVQQLLTSVDRMKNREVASVLRRVESQRTMKEMKEYILDKIKYSSEKEERYVRGEK